MQTIFSTPEPVKDWRYRAEPKRGVELGPVASVLTLPFLLIAAGLCLPYALGWGLVQQRNSRKLLARMKAFGRVMEWSDFIRALDKKYGTTIVERYSFSGPVHLWWTSENFYDECPYPAVDWEALHDEAFLEFAKWCRERYSSPNAGRALLVGPCPKGEARSLLRQFESGDTEPGETWIEIVPPERVRKRR